jgi:1-aminocyclopropane-1-carboxylate deaminase/D-cysteine desulfhydrase-like pyridoxal-dependent ACC family enzyme
MYLMYKLEGIYLDHVYTAKEFAGMIRHVKLGNLKKQDNIVWFFRI